MEEGRGFKLFKGDKGSGGKFEFASSNPLWRASLDTLDFMSLLTVVDYAGGMYRNYRLVSMIQMMTDEAIKISIKFLIK